MYYPGIYSANKVNDNLKRLSSRELVVDYGYTHGYNKKKSVREKLLQRKEDLMVKKISGQKTNSNIEKDDLKSYYEENKDIYSKPDKYKVQEIRVKDKELIEKIYNKAIADEIASVIKYGIEYHKSVDHTFQEPLQLLLRRPQLVLGFLAGSDILKGPHKLDDLTIYDLRAAHRAGPEAVPLGSDKP